MEERPVAPKLAKSYKRKYYKLKARFDVAAKSYEQKRDLVCQVSKSLESLANENRYAISYID